MFERFVEIDARVLLEGTAHVASGFCWKPQKTRVFAGISLRSKVLTLGLRSDTLTGCGLTCQPRSRGGVHGPRGNQRNPADGERHHLCCGLGLAMLHEHRAGHLVGRRCSFPDSAAGSRHLAEGTPEGASAGVGGLVRQARLLAGCSDERDA